MVRHNLILVLSPDGLGKKIGFQSFLDFGVADKGLHADLHHTGMFPKHQKTSGSLGELV